MEIKNYNLLLGTVLISYILFTCNISRNHSNEYDRFVYNYLKKEIRKIIVTKSWSETNTEIFNNKRFEFKDLKYYYGRLVPDIYYEDHIKNIISKERKEAWNLIRECDKYERFDLDSNKIFHEVLIDNILIGYYLNDSIINEEIEASFGLFLLNEFNYITSKEFPTYITEW